MPVVNPLAREVVMKVVYYGPGLGGKTTTLQHIHAATKPDHRGKMVSLATPVDRTLYFDFLPLRVPRVRDLGVRLQLFTVPGQVYYNATRKLVLTGADGVVFVADSQRARADSNLESLENLRENLREHGRKLGAVPHVLQYNKRDLGDLLTRDELEESLNGDGAAAFDTVATTGTGVFEALDAITRAVLDELERRLPAPRSRTLREGLETPEGGIAEALRREADSQPPPAAVVPTQHDSERPSHTPDFSDASLNPRRPKGELAAREVLEPGRPSPSSKPAPEPEAARGEEEHEAFPLSKTAPLEAPRPLAAAAEGPLPPVVGPDGRRPVTSLGTTLLSPGQAGPDPGLGALPPAGAAPAVLGGAGRGRLTRGLLESAARLVPELDDAALAAGLDGDDFDLEVGIESNALPEAALEPVATAATAAARGDGVAEPGPTDAAGAPPTAFAQLWPPGAERGAAAALEASLAAGDARAAVARADELVARSLASAAGLLGGGPDAPRDPAVVVTLLGLDGRRYLAFRGAVRDLRGGSLPTMTTARLAYLFAVNTRVAIDLLKP